MFAVPLFLSLAMQQPLDLSQLQGLLSSNPPEAASRIRSAFSAEDLKRGINPYDQGTRVLFAVDAGEGSHVVKLLSGNREVALLDHLGGGLYAKQLQFEDGDGFPAQYVVDGKALRTGLQVEVYVPNPIVLAPPGGRKGELRDMGVLNSKVFADTTRKWYMFLPPGFKPSDEYPVLIATDAQWDRDWMANGLENAAREGMIPPTVGIFIEPGQNTPGTYSNRSAEYDPLSPKYSEFLLAEILPEVGKIVKLSPDPAKRALIGVSSGGICAFTACWERPEQFGVAISFVGSFANIASGASKRDGGHNYPFLIRKTDKKPIRVLLQDGENDLNNDHGSWWICNLQMESALRYKGYDYKWFPGKAFHSTKHARNIFDQVLMWWLGKK